MHIPRFATVCLLLLIGTTSLVSGKVSEDDLTLLKIDSSGLYYEEVTPVEGVSAEDLYSRAKAWMAKTYRSSNTVIQLDDKENKKIIGKGVLEVSGYMGTKLKMRHTITFESRDGRYKIRIDDLIVMVPEAYIGNQRFAGSESELSDARGRIISNAEKEVGLLAQSLKDALQQSSNNANDAW